MNAGDAAGVRGDEEVAHQRCDPFGRRRFEADAAEGLPEE